MEFYDILSRKSSKKYQANKPPSFLNIVKLLLQVHEV